MNTLKKLNTAEVSSFLGQTSLFGQLGLISDYIAILLKKKKK